MVIFHHFNVEPVYNSAVRPAWFIIYGAYERDPVLDNLNPAKLIIPIVYQVSMEEHW